MCIARVMTKGGWVVLGIYFSLALLVPVSEAQFVVTDNFNRADGVPRLAWSTWGNGAQISSDQLETFGKIDVAGGVARILRVSFPLSFSFDFRTDAPTDGGWIIGFNAGAPAVVIASDTSEIELRQNNGSTAICVVFQTSSGPSLQCGNTVSGQRDFTSQAHISGTVKSDFSSAITITYNDGLSPATVTLTTPAPVGAIRKPMGSILFFGNANMSNGPHFFDNFSVTLK
jgi:hypothetical protein